MGTWLGTYKKEIYSQGYNQGYKQGYQICQKGYLPEPYERHIEKNPRLKPKSQH